MKKLMIACLACVLAVVLVVPAFAASATRIGSTSYYYISATGFGGGDRSDGKAYVTSSALSSYLVNAKSAYSSYSYELTPLGGDMCIGVYSSSNGKLGYLSTSGGLIYASQVEYYIDTGGTSTSSIDYSSVLSSILSAVNTVADNVTSVYSFLTYSTGQRQYSVASLLYSCQLYLDHLETKLTATNGYIDELESKIDTSNTRLNTLNTTTSNGFSNVIDKLTDIEKAISKNRVKDTDIIVPITDIDNNLNLKLGSLIDLVRDIDVAPFDDSNVLDKIDILTDEVYRGNSNLNTIDSHVDGLESSIVVTNNRISTVDTDLNNFYASTSAGFTDVLNNFSRVSGQLVDIQNLLSGLNNSPVVSTTNSPYVRKIYNVLYDGVDGTGTDMVDIATSQMGVSEGRPYYTWYGFNSHVEWCAVFVSWCADQCGYLDDIIPKFAVVDDGADWFKARSLWLDGGAAVASPVVETQTITPVRITDNGHNYVTINVDISEDGTLTVSGDGKNGGKFYNPEVVPAVADFSGNQTVTVYWGGSASSHRSDSRQVKLVYDVNSVISGDGSSDVSVDVGTPSPGDIIFFDWDVDHDPDHVGIVADCVDGIVTTVEGNTGDSPGVVSSRSIAVDSPLIYGYGTPDYPAGGSSIYSVLVGISNKIGKSPVAGISSYDDTVLIAKLTDIENALSKLGGDVVVSIDNVTNVDIPLDNDAHDVFYVTDDDGDKSIVDLSGDSVKIVGKLMNFLYQAMFKDALNDSESGIQGLYDFYLDDSEGVDVWAS